MLKVANQIHTDNIEELIKFSQNLPDDCSVFTINSCDEHIKFNIAESWIKNEIEKDRGRTIVYGANRLLLASLGFTQHPKLQLRDKIYVLNNSTSLRGTVAANAIILEVTDDFEQIFEQIKLSLRMVNNPKILIVTSNQDNDAYLQLLGDKNTYSWLHDERLF